MENGEFLKNWIMEQWYASNRHSIFIKDTNRNIRKTELKYICGSLIGSRNQCKHR